MRITANNSPLAGTEGTWVQSNRIYERLRKETLRNVSIRLEVPPENDCFILKGRGELQLAIIIETMRREGFELCVGRPEVISVIRGGELLEPIEHLYIDCDEEYLGVVTQKLSIRKGRMINFANHAAGRVRIEFNVLRARSSAIATSSSPTPRKRDHELISAGLRAIPGSSPPGSPAPSWRTAEAWPCPTPCTTSNREAGYSSPRVSRSTKA